MLVLALQSASCLVPSYQRFHYHRRKHSKMSGRFKILKSPNDDQNLQSAATSANFIPHLPDNVIEKVLFLLPIDRVAQANTISKRWATLWPSFREIYLDKECFSQPQRFLSFLHHSLRRCSNQRQLNKLSIRANLDYNCSLVSARVDFAIELCVKELDILDLDVNDKLLKNMLITHDVLTLKSLTNLKNVRLYASSGIVNGPVSLPSLKTMSLKDVTFIDDVEESTTCGFPRLLSGCPCIKHLSIDKFTAKNLESLTYYSDCSSGYHMAMYLWKCDSLKYLDISCKELVQLSLHNCLENMENLVHTPNLQTFEFSGYLKTKVNFVEAPSHLFEVKIRVWKTLWPIEYYSSMRDFLESFDFSEKVKIHIDDAEGVIIPEHCRLEWPSPLPSIKHLQLYFPASLGKTEYCLRPSLIWMAPSAEFLPFRTHDEYDNDDDDDDNITDEDNDNDDDNENVDVVDD